MREDSQNNKTNIMYAGLIRLLFLIRHVNLIGAWLSEDHITTNTIKSHVSKKLDYIFKLN